MQDVRRSIGTGKRDRVDVPICVHVGSVALGLGQRAAKNQVRCSIVGWSSIRAPIIRPAPSYISGPAPVDPELRDYGQAAGDQNASDCRPALQSWKAQAA